VDILIIDDNELQLNYLTELLQSNGYRTQTLQEGTKAIEIIGKVKPKLVILDIMMPGIDGFTVLKKIRENQHFKTMPVIIYTGKAYQVDRKKALFLGANSFLAKPVKGAVIIEEVKKYL
jgi:DNA-binding response OmpR family regulator